MIYDEVLVTVKRLCPSFKNTLTSEVLLFLPVCGRTSTCRHIISPFFKFFLWGNILFVSYTDISMCRR